MQRGVHGRRLQKLNDVYPRGMRLELLRRPTHGSPYFHAFLLCVWVLQISNSPWDPTLLARIILPAVHLESFSND